MHAADTPSLSILVPPIPGAPRPPPSCLLEVSFVFHALGSEHGHARIPVETWPSQLAWCPGLGDFRLKAGLALPWHCRAATLLPFYFWLLTHWQSKFGGQGVQCSLPGGAEEVIPGLGQALPTPGPPPTSRGDSRR